MIALTAKPGFNYNAFFAAMHERFTDWQGNVQIAHAAQRNTDGSKRIAIRINPLHGFQLPVDAEQAAQEVLAEVSA